MPIGVRVESYTLQAAHMRGGGGGGGGGVGWVAGGSGGGRGGEGICHRSRDVVVGEDLSGAGIHPLDLLVLSHLRHDMVV